MRRPAASSASTPVGSSIRKWSTRCWSYSAARGRLTARTPVADPRRVPLRPRADRLAAARTGPPGLPVDAARLAAGLRGLEHQPAGRLEDADELIVAQRPDRGVRVDPGLEAALRPEDVADAGNQPLPEQRLTELQVRTG